MTTLHPEQAIEQLEHSASALPEGELKRRCEKLASLMRELESGPEPSWVEANLRLLERYVFSRPSIEALPPQMAEGDPEGLYGQLWLMDLAQHELRRELYRRFKLRPIIGPEQEPYDEHSPRFVVNKTRATGNTGLDWCIAQTVALGFEWEGTPAVLRPARVDVYRYVDSTQAPTVTSVVPRAIPCGAEAEVELRGTQLGGVRSVWIGGNPAKVESVSDDLLIAFVEVPRTSGGLTVEVSDLADAQVPAHHRQLFHGLLMGYTPLLLDVESVDGGTLTLRHAPVEAELHFDENLEEEIIEPGTRRLTLGEATGKLPTLHGTAVRKFPLLAGSNSGLQDTTAVVEERFTLAVALTRVVVRPPTLPAAQGRVETMEIPAPVLPAVDAPALPAVEAPDLPAVDAPALPAVDAPVLPAVDAPVLPAVDAPALPAVPRNLPEPCNILLVTPDGRRIDLGCLEPGGLALRLEAAPTQSTSDRARDAITGRMIAPGTRSSAEDAPSAPGPEETR